MSHRSPQHPRELADKHFGGLAHGRRLASRAAKHTALLNGIDLACMRRRPPLRRLTSWWVRAVVDWRPHGDLAAPRAV